MHIIRALSWERLSSMGWGGFTTLALSFMVVMVSGGLTFFVCWAIVIKFALRSATPAPTPDVILVLGARLNRGEITREFQARLDGAARQPTACPVILLGGMAMVGGLTEAAAGRSWLIARGFDQTRIIMEEASRNTLENLSHARSLMKHHDFLRPLVVTSRYHMARSSILARGLGISHDLSPTDYPSMWHPAALARSIFEALMINWYYVGRAFSQVTGQRAMLKRIS